MARDSRGTSRRRFVKAVSASGAAAGLTGYLDDGTVGNVQEDGGTTVQWATDPDFESDVWDRLQETLYDNGLSNDIEIEILAGTSVTDDRRSQYQQWLSAGREQPDLLYVDNGWALSFIVRDQLQNLSELLSDEQISTIEDDYFQASVDTAKGPDGDLYAVPLFPDFPTMLYNKDYVSEAGYGEDDFETWAQESMTWQDFSTMVSDALEANDDVEYGFTFQAQAYEGLACCTFNEFMTSWGGAYFGNPAENLFGPVGDRPVTVGEEQVVDSVRMIRTFIHGSDADQTLDDYEGNISPPAVLQWEEEPSRQPFTSGNAIAHRNWPYSINESGSDDALGESLGVMPIPYAVTEEEAEYPGTGGPVAALGGWHNAINPNSQNKEAAAEVLTAMMSEEFKLALFEEIGFLPPEPDLLEADRAQEVPIMGRYLDQLQIAGENAIPRPVTEVWPQQAQRIAQQVNQAYTQDSNPEQLMNQLQQQLEEIEGSA